MITRVRVDNWRKFSGSQEWTFDKGIQLVYGENTSGKSSLLEAIRFAFFGINEKVEDIPNNDITRQAIVELDFIGQDKELYRIIRGFKKINRKEESFSFYRIENGQEFPISSDPLDAITAFGTAEDVFSHINFLKEGEIYRALIRSKNNLSSELAEILHLDRFDHLMVNLRETRLSYVKRLKNLAKDISLSLSIDERKELEQQIKAFEQKIVELHEEKKKIEEEKKIAENKQSIQSKIERLEKEKQEYGSIIKEMRKKYSQKQNIIDFLKNEIEEIEEKNNELKTQLDQLNRTKYEAEAEQKKYTKLISEIEDFESSHETTCPTCYQKVNPDILKEAK
ncbi:MAG: AAA family ATPase, partial [Candidatus Heimdallarchaeaceae archaeon]